MTVTLSARERDVLRGVVADKTYGQIANDLKLSVETIKTYAARLRSKVNVRTKTGLALYAIKHKLLRGH